MTSLADAQALLDGADAATRRDRRSRDARRRSPSVERALHRARARRWRRSTRRSRRSSRATVPPRARRSAVQGARSPSWSRPGAPSSPAAAAAGAVDRDRLDLTLGGHGVARGHLHLVTQVQRELEDIFVGMGYRVMRGPRGRGRLAQLRSAQHPARASRRARCRTRSTSSSARAEQVLLRTHTSPVQIRTMETQQPPIYVVAPGRTYRNETPSPRHSPVFHQIEALVVDRGITLADLFGTIETFVRALFGDESIRTRFRPDFFPYTEPSAELAVSCIFCDGEGCRVCFGSGWLELGGCGHGRPQRARRRWASTPRSTPGSRSASASSASRWSATASTRSRRSSTTTSDSWRSTDARAPVLDPRVHAGRRAGARRSSSRAEPARPRGGGGRGARPRDQRCGRGAGCSTSLPHPDADKLRLADVDFGGGQTRVVCGAPNIAAGMVVPYAPSARRCPAASRSNGARSAASCPTACCCRARELGPRRRPQRHHRASTPRAELGDRRARRPRARRRDLRPVDHAQPARRDVHRRRRARARRALQLAARRPRARRARRRRRCANDITRRDRSARPLPPLPRPGRAGHDGGVARRGWRSGS